MNGWGILNFPFQREGAAFHGSQPPGTNGLVPESFVQPRTVSLKPLRVQIENADEQIKPSDTGGGSGGRQGFPAATISQARDVVLIFVVLIFVVLCCPDFPWFWH